MVIKQFLANLAEEGNLRKLPDEMPSDMLDFASNDYLGVASRKDYAEEFLSNGKPLVFSSSASRLLASKQDVYNELESMLRKEYSREILIFNSGYHANTGIIPAIASVNKTLIVADKLVHASIIDGIVISRCDFRRFHHNDLRTLRRIVEENHTKYERILIITESVFSMDGDSPDLEGFLALKKEYSNLTLYIDEAHAFGVKGKRGLGLAYSSSSFDDWDIVVCPLGKAAASMGAFVVCSDDIKKLLINRSRALIFSTALPPVQVLWTTFILDKIFKMDSEREHLNRLSSLFAEMLTRNYPSQIRGSSHIQPLIIGNAHETINLSSFLESEGIRALPIRKPTVPAGTERIRFSLSARMRESDIENVGEVLKKFNESRIYN